ncbi:MAG: class I SAM-dependent methyltransferase [Chloroflexota bacterium]
MEEKILFDEWPERYDQWFTTPIGKLVRESEGKLIIDLLHPGAGERILDAGCGTGVFTLDFLVAGARVVGLDISVPMLNLAIRKTAGYDFSALRGDMEHLPFKDNSFDKAVSVTALEFIANGRGAVNELFRVTRPGGWVVVATLNSLSPWAARRRAKTESGQRHILEGAFFRSPDELLSFSQYRGTAKTVVHFQKDDEPEPAARTEELGRLQALDTGAFVAVRWQKPV